MRKSQFPVSLLLIILLMACSFAATKPEDMKFLKPDSLDYKAVIPPAVALGSAELKEEIETVLRVQASRTEADVERAKSEIKTSLHDFQSVMGDSFNPKSLPKTAALFKQIEVESKFFSAHAKDFYDRPRPSLVDSRVKSAVETEKEPAYPSGHATRGMLFALILSEIAPDKKDALIARGLEIGWDRVVLGVHYPSDVSAGRALGKALAPLFLTNLQFQSELAEARKEIEAASTHPLDMTK